MLGIGRKLAHLLTRLTGKRTAGTATVEAGSPSGAGEVWCLVGNVVDEHSHGEEGAIKQGSKHFTAGTKVYCLAPQWGDGFERVVAVGLHRGSRQWVTVVMPSDQITNWRAKAVYKPAVLKRLREGFRGPHGHVFRGQWASRREVESWARELRQSRAAQ